ncbi:MAG: carbon starvation protein A [Vulcanimicrobiota bacterium]
MDTLLVAFLSFVGFIVAYRTYGKWLADKIFGLHPENPVPAHTVNDGVDYVPTKAEIVFGHHFTSIAGTGPIVGPAVAVFWGWLPALLWVIFGSIFIGAVHDFGALVVSMRSEGKTVGDLAGRLINPRARLVFLLILFFALTIVLGVFGLVIAIIFSVYPETVLSVWMEIPIAIAVGWWAYKRKGGLLIPSIVALILMYGFIVVGCYWLPVEIPLPLFHPTLKNTVVFWTVLLFVYCFIASVLPVWVLLQPRDYINSHQLLVALGMLVTGLAVASLTGQVSLFATAPAVATEIPPDAPPILPFLFITIACGAISGFHCLVSSGTTSKQVECETDAQSIGYGAMLLEGALAVLVILCCCSGLGMGEWDRDGKGAQYDYLPAIAAETGQALKGRDAWLHHYTPVRAVIKENGEVEQKGGWASLALADQLAGFIEGGANFLSTLGLPIKLCIAIIAVLVASFAATTLDTATRLQRYVVQELAESLHFGLFTNKYAATALAVGLGLLVAFYPGTRGPGSGGLILWPLFGAINQLLAGLAFMVVSFYLLRRNRPVWFLLGPMALMILLPAWAMLWQMFNSTTGWLTQQNYLLLGFGGGVLCLQIWMLIEGLSMFGKVRGLDLNAEG